MYEPTNTQCKYLGSSPWFLFCILGVFLQSCRIGFYLHNPLLPHLPLTTRTSAAGPSLSSSCAHRPDWAAMWQPGRGHGHPAGKPMALHSSGWHEAGQPSPCPGCKVGQRSSHHLTGRVPCSHSLQCNVLHVLARLYAPPVVPACRGYECGLPLVWMQGMSWAGCLWKAAPLCAASCFLCMHGTLPKEKALWFGCEEDESEG